MTAIGSVPRGNICIHSGMLFIGAEDLPSGCGSGPTPALPQTRQIASRRKLRRPIRGAASRVRRKHSSGVGTKQTQSQRESAWSPASSRKAAAGARGWVNSRRKSSLKTMTHRVVRRHQSTVVEGLKWRRKLPLPVRATVRSSSKGCRVTAQRSGDSTDQRRCDRAHGAGSGRPQHRWLRQLPTRERGCQRMRRSTHERRAIGITGGVRLCVGLSRRRTAAGQPAMPCSGGTNTDVRMRQRPTKQPAGCS